MMVPKNTPKQRYDTRLRYDKLLKTLPAELDELLTSSDFVEFSKSHLQQLKQLRDVLDHRIYELEQGLEYYPAIYEIKGRDLFYMRTERFSYRRPGNVGGLNEDEEREADIHHPDISHIKAQLLTAGVSPKNRRIIRKAVKEGLQFPQLPETIHLDDIQKYLKTR